MTFMIRLSPGRSTSNNKLITNWRACDAIENTCARGQRLAQTRTSDAFVKAVSWKNSVGRVQNLVCDSSWQPDRRPLVRNFVLSRGVDRIAGALETSHYK
eukprot:2611320-Pyramimonas_sp.AAC.1